MKTPSSSHVDPASLGLAIVVETAAVCEAGGGKAPRRRNLGCGSRRLGDSGRSDLDYRYSFFMLPHVFGWTPTWTQLKQISASFRTSWFGPVNCTM